MKAIFWFPLLCLMLASCSQHAPEAGDNVEYHSLAIEKVEPQWWHNTIFYEIWPRSFYDSDGDGSGDFQGMIEKLDYLAELGVSGLWLTPVFEAPSYHGYDFLDFYSVEQDYGTMEDFEELIAQSHKRDIKVILDLVLNHISRDHEWFQKSAARVPGYEDYFVWSDEILEGWGKPWTTTVRPEWVWHWSKTRGQYYYGAFDASQPDLNLRNPKVIAELNRMAEFWLDKGVDGFRLDAVRYAIEDGPLARQSDTDATIDYWTQFTQFVKSKKPDAMLVGEAWTGLNVIGKYHDQGRGLDSAFDFDFGYVVSGILNPESSRSADFGTLSTANLQHNRVDLWHNLKGRVDAAPISFFSPFLTNHDQNRIAHTLNNDVNKTKIAASLLWTSPGPLYMYYGEEIGMTQKFVGDDQYRRAIMQWKDDAAAGFNTTKEFWIDQGQWFPWLDEYQGWWGDYWQEIRGTGATVEAQQADPNSLWSHYKRLITVRNAEKALQFPEEIRYYPVNNDDVWLVHHRHHGSSVWVVVNLNSDASASFDVPAALQGKQVERLTGRTVTLPQRMRLEAAETMIF